MPGGWWRGRSGSWELVVSVEEGEVVEEGGIVVNVEMEVGRQVQRVGVRRWESKRKVGNSRSRG